MNSGPPVSGNPLPQRIPVSQQAIAVLWPSFAIAIVSTGLFFSAFNPADLYPFDADIPIKPLAAYSIGFFAFWLLAALSSYGTLYFLVSNIRVLGSRGE